jgi:hypothetical protein
MHGISVLSSKSLLAFYKRLCNLHASPNIPPHILKAIYSELTCDASALQNPTHDSRVRQAILSKSFSNTSIEEFAVSCGNLSSVTLHIKSVKPTDPPGLYVSILTDNQSY